MYCRGIKVTSRSDDFCREVTNTLQRASNAKYQESCLSILLPRLSLRLSIYYIFLDYLYTRQYKQLPNPPFRQVSSDLVIKCQTWPISASTFFRFRVIYFTWYSIMQFFADDTEIGILALIGKISLINKNKYRFSSLG